MSADADLVMMSKASDPQLAAMTQRAIDTARNGAVPRAVNVIVMEQTTHQYQRATTVYAPGSFNYNAFANHGAKLGSAPHIVIANNDLVFRDGWLDALIEVNWPVCSPISPGYHRHYGVLGNECGHQVGRHLAGWCFMIDRTLWEDIGGLDETYPFWCADNAVMKQVQAKGIRPMLVRSSQVDHKVSATLFREDADVQAELTWAAVHRFNEEHNGTIGLMDVRYQDWQRRNGIQGQL